MATTLDGATQRPAQYVECADAGEFAALWNSLDDQSREAMFRNMRRNQQVSLNCIIENHAATAYQRDRGSIQFASPRAEGEFIAWAECDADRGRECSCPEGACE